MAGFIGGILALDSQLFITSAGDNNDVPLSSSLMYISVTNEMDAITGIDVGDITQGFLFLVVNTSTTKNLKIKNNSASSIAQNRILTADGNDYILPPSNTAIIGYDTTGQRSHIIRVPDVPISTSYANPADPATTTSSAGVMMGLGIAITPVKSGKVFILISGDIDNNTAGDGARAQIRYGTGSAPANGAALTGTAAGTSSGITNALIALLVPGSGNFTCQAVVPALALGTAYWIDISLARVTGGTARVRNISVTVMEL